MNLTESYALALSVATQGVYYKGLTLKQVETINDMLKVINLELFWKKEDELKQQQKEIESLKAQLAKYQSDDYVLVPREPTHEMWSGFSRHLGRYVQMHDRFSPLSLDKYIKRFVGEKNKPLFLNKEVQDWSSDHAFATADIPVFIYKAMIEAQEQSNDAL